MIRLVKNLIKEELESLELIVSICWIWLTRIDKFLLVNERDILKDAGKISHEISCNKALTEYEK